MEKENVEWSHVFNSGEEMAVGKTDIYIKAAELKDEDGKLQVWRKSKFFLVKSTIHIS